MIKNRQLSFMGACDIGDSLIVIDELGRGIFQIDKGDMSAHLLATLKNMEHWRNLYQCAECLNNEIFFFPYCFINEEIVIYHLENQQIEYLKLEKISSLVQGDYKPVQRVNNTVWLFPTDFTRDLVIFHLDTRKVEMMSQWKNVMQNIVLDYNDSWRKIGKSVEIQETLYYAVKGMNYIIATNKNTYESKCYALPSDKKLSTSADCDGQKIWMVEWNNKGIIAWDPATNNIQYYSMVLVNERLKSNNLITRILCGQKYLWLIPDCDSRLVRMDYETGNFEFIDIFPLEFNCGKEKQGRMFYTIIKKENVTDIYPFTSNMVIHIDLGNDVLLECREQILLPSEWSEQDIVDYELQDDNEYEPSRISKDIYMDFFFHKICKTDVSKASCTCGEKIWEYVSGE